MKLSLVLVIISAAIFLISVASADQDDNLSSTEATNRNVYMGVDANDEEAVKQKQDELNKEKWQLLFGDVDIEELDFSPEFEKSSNKGVMEGLKGLFHGILEKILRKKPSSTTQTPL